LVPGEWLDGPLAAPVAWQTLGLHTLDAKGRSPLLTTPVPDNSRYVAIRATALPMLPSEPACVRLADVDTGTGLSWVGPDKDKPDAGICTNCLHRVQSGHGYGLFVFPNDGKPLPNVSSLQFRVTLQHCETGLPLPLGLLGSQVTKVEVEVASEPLPTADQPAKLALVLVAAPGALASLDGLAGHARAVALRKDPLAAALEQRLVAGFAAVAVAASVRGWIALPAKGLPSVAPLHVGNPDRSDVDALQSAVDAAITQVWTAAKLSQSPAGARIVPVVLVPCLNVAQYGGAGDELAGFSLRIPGGSRVGNHASMVLIATQRCGGTGSPSSTAKLAALTLHEVGHYLGLYHTDDALGLHRSATETDVMISGIAMSGKWQAGFTAKQAVVIRTNPLVSFGP